MKDSIYTRKLTLRGGPVPETMRADVQLSRRASEMMHPVSTELLRAIAEDGDGARANYIAVQEDDLGCRDVLAKMRAGDASVALVESKDGQLTAGLVQGEITRKDILDTLADDMELFSG